VKRRTFLQVSASVVAGCPSLTFGRDVFEVADYGYTVSLAIIKSFASELHRVMDVEVCLEALRPFGRSGRRALYHSIFSDDNDTNFIASICVRHDFQMFEEYLPSFPAMLKHSNPLVNEYAPSLLWQYGEKARFAIPQLEECLKDKRPCFRALVANAIAIIDPDRKPQMISILERSTHDEMSRCILADLRDEDPFQPLKF
jgi:hypothetical protein